MWNPAAYTSNVGYVGEYDVVANGNLATATEKTRGMAKLGGFQVITLKLLPTCHSLLNVQKLN